MKLLIFIFVFFLPLFAVVSLHAQIPNRDPLSTATTFSSINSVDVFFQTIAHPKDPVTPDTLSSFDCERLAERGDSYQHYGKYRWAYDSLKYYIEQCGMQEGAWSEFSSITIAATGLAGIGIPGADTVFVWKEYENWLKSVLNLNPDKQYFCSDVFEVARAFEFFSESSNTSPDWNAAVSISRFAEDSLCPSWSSSFESLIKQARHIQHSLWQDTVQDSIKTPLDTTLKTLDQLGVGYLRQYSSGVAYIPKTSNIIGKITASPNPFGDEVELQYSLNEGAATRIEVYDALGKLIWDNGQGYRALGKYSVKIPTKSWSSGTYYTRVLTVGGEVKTVKLIHE